MFIYVLVKRRSTDTNQPGEVRSGNYPIFPQEVIFLKAGWYLPWRPANRSAGPGAVTLGLGHAFPDPLHCQLALHLDHGAQDGLHELKHIIIVSGVKTLFYKINSHIAGRVRACYPFILFCNLSSVKIGLQLFIYNIPKFNSRT